MLVAVLGPMQLSRRFSLKVQDQTVTGNPEPKSWSGFMERVVNSGEKIYRKPLHDQMILRKHCPIYCLERVSLRKN